MSRIAGCFDTLRRQGRKALIPYVTAGDPEPSFTVGLMHDMVRAGVDIIELGVPFSDPMADGPVIQRAAERALVHGVSLHDVLGMVREFRRQDSSTPVVLMGYLNPVEVMGYEAFATAAAAAGVDGVLTVDMPPEEAQGLIAALRRVAIDPIFLLAPNTDAARISAICAAASGYVYYVSLKGVTGAGTLDTGAVAQKLKQIRGLTQLPIGVGFGIRDAASAAAVAREADAVVVGSALVQNIEKFDGQNAKIREAIIRLLTEMRLAMDQGTVA
jgi:tryptophan synthase alpha chain